MRCRRTICAACCTKLDGVNHCHQCLRALSRRVAEPRAAAGRGAGTIAAAVTLVLGCVFLFLECLLVEGRLAP
jgi:hypothetical protein